MPPDNVISEFTNCQHIIGAMQVGRIIPATHLALGTAILAFLIAGPADAQEDLVLPHLLILPEKLDTVFPGDESGANHGVIVRRGSGFPEPIVVEADDEPVDVRPEPARRRAVVRRTRRYGY